MGKLPYITLYPGDWLQDQVSGCSIGAQGLWLRLMFIMHSAERYGYLTQNGSPTPSEALARRCGLPLEQYESLVTELEQAHVFNRTDNGIIYSRRMVRDAEKRSHDAQRKRKERKKRKDSDT